MGVLVNTAEFEVRLKALEAPLNAMAAATIRCAGYRAAVAALASLALFPAAALADSEQDRIAALEARISALESAPSPRVTPVRSVPRWALAPGALMASRISAFGSPLFGATITGGGSVSSSGMPDPYVPVDGTMDVTGAVTATGRGYFGGASGGVVGGVGYNNVLSWATNDQWGIKAAGTTSPFQISGGHDDGASSVAVRIAAYDDYTTSGAKIASFGDAAGTTYAEKSYVDKDGYIGGTASMQIYSAAGSSLVLRRGTTGVLSAGGATNRTLLQNDPYAVTPLEATIADDGAGTAAAATLATVARSQNRYTCSDANGCDLTLGESGTVDGQIACFTNVSANVLNFADTAGVTEMAGAFAAGQYDSVCFVYDSDRWVETSRSNN